MIKNLSQLKKELVPGAKFEILEHTMSECVGQTREINIAKRSFIEEVTRHE